MSTIRSPICHHMQHRLTSIVLLLPCHRKIHWSTLIHRSKTVLCNIQNLSLRKADDWLRNQCGIKTITFKFGFKKKPVKYLVLKRLSLVMLAVSFRLAYSFAVAKCQVNVLLLTLNVNTDVLITSCVLVHLCQITSEHFWTGYFTYPCLINKYT